jgi:hypothetical protein
MKKIALTICFLFLFASYAHAVCSFSVAGGDTTITCSYIASTTVMQTNITDAAHYLYNLGEEYRIKVGNNYVLFENLTNQQKLNMVDKFIRKSVIGIAAQYKFQADEALSIITSNQTYTMQ